MIWLKAMSRRSGPSERGPQQRRGRRALSVGVLLVGMALHGAPHPAGQAAANTPASTAAAGQAAAIEQARQAFAQAPLAFVPNQGQTDPQVRYVAQASGAALFLTPTEAVLALSPVDDKRPGLALRMQFAGANPQPQLVAEAELPGKIHYLQAGAERTRLPAYGSVRYQNAYPGVDLAFSGAPGRLRSTMTVQSGADLSALALRYEGADRVEVEAAGALVLHTAGGELRSPQPVASQEIDGERRPVEARYVLRGDGRVGFDLGPHDAAYKVKLEPELIYSTYLGGSSFDRGFGIAVDRWGHAYVTGQTASDDFPVTAGSFQRFRAGSVDAYVTKLSRDGSAQVYSTYLGGSGADFGRAIAVDDWGHAFVTGRSASTNFPVTAFAFQPRRASQDDVFVTKLSQDGSALVYSTYLGGRFDDDGFGIAIDPWGNAYVTGEVNSDDFPTTPGAFQPNDPDGAFIRDAFVTKLNARGTDLVYSTYLGGNNGDNGRGIAVDPWGNAYVAGRTFSTNFPTENPFQSVLKGITDAFVTKLTADGSDLVYSTYLGGSGNDDGHGIAVNHWGNAYVTGSTPSTDFPVTPGAFQENPGGNGDAFVTKFTADGSDLVYSTYLGGSGGDVGNGIAVDGWGNAYVTGETGSTDFPTEDAFQPDLGGNSDAFVTKLNQSGTDLVYSSYLGGSETDRGNAIALDKWGAAYVAGDTVSPDFPVTPGAFQEDPAGDEDAFVTKIGEDGY